MPSGYSGTPLAKKLGIKSGAYYKIVNAPDDYFDLFEEWPSDSIEDHNDQPETLDFIHLFCSNISEMLEHYHPAKTLMKKNGMMWVSWPKKSSGIKTDINSNEVRSFILDNGLVDVKVASINDIWSGLKAVYRVVDR